MKFDIITLFPEVIEKYCSVSVLKKAQERRLVIIKAHQLRDFAVDKRKTVDDAPYGGGAGMVIMAPPIIKAVGAIKSRSQKTKIAILSAKGKQFTQKTAYNWARHYKHFILITGRYEGIDERARKILKADEICIGPYVLTDGDVAAMAVISAIARLAPGVIKTESLQEESYAKEIGVKKRDLRTPFKSCGSDSNLEYPQYTRPEAIEHKGKKYRVPGVLLQGNHKKIREWRQKNK